MECTAKETSVDYMSETVDKKTVHFILSYNDGKIIPEENGSGDTDIMVKKNDIEKSFRNGDEVHCDSKGESYDSCSYCIEDKDDDQCQAPSLGLNIDVLIGQFLEIGQCLPLKKFSSLDKVAR